MIDAITSTKAKSLAVYFGISVPFLSYIWIDVDFLMTWLLLMIIDTIMGSIISIWVSQFKSSTFTERFRNKAVLALIVCAVAFVGTSYPQMTFLANAMMFGCGLSELISILRHGYMIIYKEKLPESEVIKLMLKSAIGFLERKAMDVPMEDTKK